MTGTPVTTDPFARALAGQYQIIREIGRGGMGVVYLARDLKLERDVAIKTLPPQLTNDPMVRERFLREARTAARLSHPNIVPIHRADEIDGHVFFVMGYVDGAPLSQLVRTGGPLSPRLAVAILFDVTAALGYAHAAGVVHRDVKAENILIEQATGRALVTDFGIARLAEATPLTASGTVLGTVYYMSPEQVAGDAVDPRSDLYSLGVVAFYALSGRFPFESPTASAVLVAHVTKTAPPLAAVAPTVPPSLAEVVDQLLRKDPASRYQNCAELAEALARAEVHFPEHDIPAPPPVGQALISSTDAQSVWRRAAELQNLSGPMPTLKVDYERASRRAADPATSGYRIDQVRSAADDVGIDARFVERALEERGLGSDAALVVRDTALGKRNPFHGRRPNISFEAVVPGEMPEREFDVMVEIIRRYLNDAGMVSAIGRSLNWTSGDKQRRVQVTVLVRDGKTSILVSERLRELAAMIFAPIMAAGSGFTMGPAIALAAGALHNPLLIPPILVATVGTLYTTARTIFSKVAKKREATLRELTERLAEEARQAIARRTIGGGLGDRRLLR